MLPTQMPVIDRAVLTPALAGALTRLRAIAAQVGGGPAPPAADWLEVFDVVDGVKGDGKKTLRPASRPLVEAYVRARTWLRELTPRLTSDPADAYGRRQLTLLIQRLEEDLLRFGDG